jgi:alpha-N-arabinofuranosidase
MKASTAHAASRGMTRCINTRALLLGFMAGMCALSACHADDRSAGDAHIVVHAGAGNRTVSPLLFGSNIQWEHDGDGALVLGSPDPWFPGLVHAMVEAHVSILRFPGGDLTNTYRWKVGIGPRDKRGKGLSYAGISIDSNFGTDEFIRLCREAKLQPVMSVNVSAGPEEAADWVEYMNGDVSTPMGRLRAANGEPQPMRAVYWEIGNELYNPKQVGFSSAQNYARQVMAFAKAMKARDPGIKIGVHLEASFLQAPWMPTIYPHMATWNDEVLKIASQSVDFGIVHFYVPHDKLFIDSELSRLVFAGPATFGENLAIIRRLLKQYGREDLPLALTEYGTYFGEKIKLSERIASSENALFKASLLMLLMRDGQVEIANNFSVINNDRFGMLEAKPGKALVRRPNFEIFKTLGSMANGRVLLVDAQGPSYQRAAKGNVAAATVPLIDSIAVVRSDGVTQLAIVNRSVEESVSATIVFEQKSARRVTVHTYDTAGGYSLEWHVSETPADMTSANELHLKLPAYSFTAIDFPPT